ncbi:MAG TPA: hypothetical protein DCW68_02845 [Rhodospirillaceae bacterium]|nr:MAG: hypothetical protein A2018_05815 [Alphaproteobacteria bacterium GWF2_58_20]HAU29029.1 hypothetical protein [Rhodospirillaceae bacterium]
MTQSPPMELLVNESGEAVLVHAHTLASLPDSANYDRTTRRLVIRFEDGTTQDVGFAIDEAMDEHLQHGKSLLMVRIEGMKPAEGWDLPLTVTT